MFHRNVLPAKVSRIAETARAEGVALTEASYTILIQAFTQMGAWDRAVACLDVMEEEGSSESTEFATTSLFPSQFSFSFVINFEFERRK